MPTSAMRRIVKSAALLINSVLIINLWPEKVVDAPLYDRDLDGVDGSVVAKSCQPSLFNTNRI